MVNDNLLSRFREPSKSSEARGNLTPSDDVSKSRDNLGFLGETRAIVRVVPTKNSNIRRKWLHTALRRLFGFEILVSSNLWKRGDFKSSLSTQDMLRSNQTICLSSQLTNKRRPDHETFREPSLCLTFIRPTK